MIESEACKCDQKYHQKRKNLKLETETTHQATYKQHPLEKPMQFQAPKIQSKKYDKDVLATSYQTQYTKPKIPENSTQWQTTSSAAYQYQPKKAAFYSETQYKTSFKPNDVKVQKTPVYEYKPKAIKFEGSSTYKSQFQQKKNTDLSTSTFDAAKEYASKKVNVPFEGQSSYKAQFQKHEVKAEKPLEYKYQAKNIKFEGETNYRTNFKQPPSEVYKSSLEYCPVHPERVVLN